MNDYKFPTKEEYKELDELMTYILDEMWGTDDKTLIREGIVAYANKWHEVQVNGVDKSTEPALHKHIVSNNEVAVCQCFDSEGKMHQSTGKVCDGCEFRSAN